MNDTEMTYALFEQTVSSLLGPLTQAQQEAFKALAPLYEDWNAKINVISRKDIGSLYSHHVLHSLAIAVYLKQQRPELWQRWINGGVSVIDVGTGGGFPGIPLAILFPETKFTLCDSVGKKITVAGGVAEALGLKNVRTVNARAESLGERFDFVVSRAVASLTDFWPWVKNLFDGSILYLRGGDVASECSALCTRYGVKAGNINPWPVFGSLPGDYFDEKWLIDISR